MTFEKNEIKMPNDQDHAPEKPTLFVCYTCGKKQADMAAGAALPGTLFLTALEAHLARRGLENFPARVQKVKCLGGCNHPCAVAVAQVGKITYLYGNLPSGGDAVADAVAQTETYMRQYAESENGYVPPLDKPELFRPVLVRIPDANWISETGVVTPKAPPPPTPPVDDAPPFASPLRRAGDDA